MSEAKTTNNLNEDGTTIVLFTVPRPGKEGQALMCGRYFEDETEAENFLGKMSDYCFTQDHFKYPVLTMGIPGDCLGVPEFGLDKQTNPTKWIYSLDEFTKEVNNANPDNLAITIDSDGDAVFTDSIIQARDINPIGSFNYVSMVCKRNNQYGYYQGDVFTPFGPLEGFYKVMKENATVDDFKELEGWVDDFNKNNTDDQIDCMVWCEKSMLSEDEVDDDPSTREEAADEGCTNNNDKGANTIVAPNEVIFADLSKYIHSDDKSLDSDDHGKD